MSGIKTLASTPITSRRSLITGLVSLLAAPAIVRASNLMPVKAVPTDELLTQAWTYNLATLKYEGVMVPYDVFNARLAEAFRITKEAIAANTFNSLQGYPQWPGLFG